MESIYNKKYLKYKHKYLSEKNKLLEGGMLKKAKEMAQDAALNTIKTYIPNIITKIESLKIDQLIKTELLHQLNDIKNCNDLQCMISILVHLKDKPEKYMDIPLLKSLLDNHLVTTLLNAHTHPPQAKAHPPPQAKAKAPH
jgi:hypothetical protein